MNGFHVAPKNAVTLSWRVMILLTLVAYLSFQADERIACANGPVIREVTVPYDAPDQWPTGRWLPIPFEDYQTLARAVKPLPRKPPAVWISQTEYSATFDPEKNSLRDGQWTAHFEGQMSEPQLVSLEPISLRLADMAWESERAVWGTAPDGDTKLLVESSPSKLHGNWTLAGRRGLRRTEFDLHLPHATVSRLALKVPDGYITASSAGDVRGPTDTSEKGYSLWHLELGSETDCQIIVERAQNANPSERFVLCEQSTSYVVRQAELELSAAFEIDVSGPPVDEFIFSVAKSLQISSVTQGGDVSLSWQETSPESGQWKEIRVRASEPVIGRNRPIQLLGFVSVRPRTNFVLPQVKLCQATLSSARMNVSIESPLVLRFFKGDGVRQTQSVWKSEGVQHLVLDQYRPDASVTVNVGDPRHEVAANVLTHVDMNSERWTLTALIDWESKAGTAFSTRCQLPPEWEVTDVRMRSGMLESDLVDWTVSSDGQGPPTLQMKFKDALAAGTPKLVTITAKRLPVPPGEQVHVPAVVPVECDEFNAVVMLTHSPHEIPLVDVESDFEVVDKNAVPARWHEVHLWKRLDAITDGGVVILQAENPTNAGVFSLSATGESRSDGTVESNVSRSLVSNVTEAATYQSERLARLSLTCHLLPGNNSRSELLAAFEFLDWPEDEGFVFQLPTPASLMSVQVNGLAVLPATEEDAYRLPPLHEDRIRTIAIQYTAPMEPGFVRSAFRLIVPSVSCRILGVDWHVLTPSRFELGTAATILHWQHSPTTFPWTVRFFGPLGRRAESSVFNPLSVAAWRKALIGVGRNESNAEGMSQDQLTAAGCREYLAFSPNVPSRLELSVWNAGRLHSLTWVLFFACFLTGLLMRSERIPCAPRVVLFWLAICIAGSCCAPPLVAQFTGASLSGSLFALLFSRTLLVPLRLPWERKVNEPSTVSFQQVTATLAFAVLIAGRGTAQDTDMSNRSPVSQRKEAAAEIPLGEQEVLQILVPVDSRGEPVDAKGVVYVEPQSLKRLNILARERRHASDYLISSVEYDGKVDAGGNAVLTARIGVWALSREQPVRVFLPFTDGNLAAEAACRVDGKPHSVVRSQRGPGFVVELLTKPQQSKKPPTAPSTENDKAPPSSPDSSGSPEPSQGKNQDENSNGREAHQPRRHQVELNFHPSIKAMVGGGIVELGVPRCASSTIGMSFAKPMNRISIVNGHERSLFRSVKSVTGVSLGKSDRLLIEWTTEARQESETTTDVAVETACLIEAQPSLLRYHYRLTYDPGPRGVDHVIWQIPQGVRIREQDVTADNLLDVEISRESHGSQLHVLFSEPQTGKFTVGAQWVMPVSASGSRLSVPLPCWDCEGRAEEAATQRVGLVAANGLRMQPRLEPEVQAISLSPETFWQSWGEAPPSGRINLAYDVRVPAVLSLTIAPQAPEQSVRMDQIIRILRNRVEWSLHAEVATKQVPAFLYSIRVDSRLRIDSASVKEDDAERLAHWSNTGKGQLVLFLKDAATDVQYVTVKGRMPLNRAAPIRIPSVQFEGANCERSTLLLYHDPALKLVWEGKSIPQRLEDAQTPAAGTGQDVLQGRYLLPPEVKLPALRASSRRTRAVVDSAVLLTHKEGKTWELAAHLRCRSVSGPLRRLKVLIPPSVATHPHLECEGTPEIQEREVRLADGSLEWTLSMIPETAHELRLTIGTTLREEDGGVWNLPRATVVDATDGERYLVVSTRTKSESANSETKSSTPDASKSDSRSAALARWRPADDENRPLDSAQIPAWLNEVAGINLQTDGKSVFRAESARWSLLRDEMSPTELEDRVPLAETHLWLNRSDRVFARTRILCVRRDNEDMIVQIPPGVRVLSILRNETPFPAESGTAGRIVVPLTPDVATQTVELFWSRDGGANVYGCQRVSLELPHVSGPSPQRTLVTAVAHRNELFVNGILESKTDVVARLLDRAEGLVDFVETEVVTGVEAWNQTVRTDLQQAVNSLHQYFAQPAPNGSYEDFVALRERLRKIDETIGTLGLSLDHVGEAKAESSVALPPDIPAAFACHTAPTARRLLLGQALKTQQRSSDVWIVSAAAVVGAAMVFVFVVSSLLLYRAWHAGICDWLDRNTKSSAAFLGVIWWLFLCPSALGLLISLAAACPNSYHPHEEPPTMA